MWACGMYLVSWEKHYWCTSGHEFKVHVPILPWTNTYTGKVNYEPKFHPLQNDSTFQLVELLGGPNMINANWHNKPLLEPTFICGHGNMDNLKMVLEEGHSLVRKHFPQYSIWINPTMLFLFSFHVNCSLPHRQAHFGFIGCWPTSRLLAGSLM
jgi:hypothetical protein